MSDIDAPWLSSAQFLPQGHCFAWTPGVLWMHVIADALVATAYFTLLFALGYIVRRRKDLPFDWLVVCFGVFILATGLTHVLEIWNVWNGQYWLGAFAEGLTAAAAIPTAWLLWRSLPDIMLLPSQRELKDANESLARANRELEAFTASVSHDLRSPLTTIAGQAGLLELSLTEASEEQKRRLARIQSSVKQMSELIDALLALSRISRYTLHRETVDVSAMAETIVQDLRQRQPDRAVDVRIHPGLTVHGDRRLLGDMFENLLANAWKFTSKTERARIELGQARGGSIATLYVRDNGVGFDMAYEHKLFQPFQRLHGSTFEGSGIGLATVARIVDRHGGRIWAEGKPGAGAVFYFTLPTVPLTTQSLPSAYRESQEIAAAAAAVERRR
jgi:signal transduction histidine kinase